MQLSDFAFHLPEELIANYPPENRTDSRLLHLKGCDGTINHRQFPDILALLNPGDLMVFNNIRRKSETNSR